MPTRRTALSMVSAAIVGGVLGSFGALAQMQAGAQTPPRVGLKRDTTRSRTSRCPSRRSGVAQHEYAHDGVLYPSPMPNHRELFRGQPRKLCATVRRFLRHEHVVGRTPGGRSDDLGDLNGNLYVFAGTGGQSGGSDKTPRPGGQRKLEDAERIRRANNARAPAHNGTGASSADSVQAGLAQAVLDPCCKARSWKRRPKAELEMRILAPRPIGRVLGIGGATELA